MYLLDTNAISKIIRGTEKIRTRYEAAVDKGHSFIVSSIVLHELYFGACRSVDPQSNFARIALFVASQDGVAEFGLEDARVAGNIHCYLAKIGFPIGPYDVLIAAQALRLNYIVVTGNTREFSRVPDLKWEDWGSD
jgi:tRNA(fMet)-specific endonuclease VapC